MNLKSILIVCALGVVASSQAVVVTQWNFNSPTPDGNTATGTVSPSVGAGTLTVIGGVTASFASGSSNGGSSDPAGTVDNSGYGTTGYPAATVGNKTAGAQFLTSTVGLSNIVVSYDLRHSNTSSRYEQAQYTVNGTTWIDATVFDGNAGDTWFNNRTVNLSSVSGVNNNANFGFRVVSTFAPGGTAYAASSSTATSYLGTGTWRFDMATVSGEPVPEPASMIALGLGAAAMIRRRRKA